MDVTARKSLYIRGLQAAHSGVLEVIDDAFHVAVYQFFPDKPKWERMEIEGSVYLTRNNSCPLYSLIVLNKKGPTDLVLHVEENIEKMRIQEQYIMIQCRIGDETNTSILGLWIHDAADRERFFRSVMRIRDIRKNSPNVSSLLSKLLQRSSSSNNLESATTASSAAVIFTSKKNQVMSSTNSALASSHNQMQVMVIPEDPIEGNKASVALLNLLKPASKKDSQEKVKETITVPAQSTDSTVSSSSFSGNASLDDIIKKPEPVKSSGSSSKLTSTLKNILTSNASMDFPTDGQISAKAKTRQAQQKESTNDSYAIASSSSVATFKSLSIDSTVVVEQSSMDYLSSLASTSTSLTSSSTDALKAMLSIGNQGNVPSRSISDPITLPEKSSVAALMSVNASSIASSSCTSPVTVTSLRESLASSSVSSEGFLSPKRLFPESNGTKPILLSSLSAKKAVKLISPADLGEVF